MKCLSVGSGSDVKDIPFDFCFAQKSKTHSSDKGPNHQRRDKESKNASRRQAR